MPHEVTQPASGSGSARSEECEHPGRAVRSDPEDVVLRAERELRDVLGAVLADDEDVVLAVAAGPGWPSGTVIIGSIDTTMPCSRTVSMSSRSSRPASRP